MGQPGGGGGLVCRGLAKPGDSASPLTPACPGVPPATPTQAEERGHCPSFPAPPHGDRIWGPTPSPLPSRPGEAGVARTSGPRSARRGAKGAGWRRAVWLAACPPTLVRVGCRKPWGPPLPPDRGPEMAGGPPSGVSGWRPSEPGSGEVTGPSRGPGPPSPLTTGLWLSYVLAWNSGRPTHNPGLSPFARRGN